jgi:hypothetical protein
MQPLNELLEKTHLEYTDLEKNGPVSKNIKLC